MTTSKHTRALFLGAVALLFAQSALAAPAVSYAYRQAAVGLRNPSVAPVLGAFAIATRPAGAAAFALTPPSSSSAAAFSYASSNPAVATVLGNTVTIVGVGTTTITATQAASPGYLTAAVASSFVVGAPAGYLASGGLLWLIPISTATQQYWPNANTYCTTGAFVGWRLPTSVEAKAMALDIGATSLTAQNWNEGWTWTSTAVSAGTYNVFLNTAGVGSMQGANNKSYVTCVR